MSKLIGFILIGILVYYFFVKDKIENSDKDDKDDKDEKVINKTLSYGTAGCVSCDFWNNCEKTGYFIQISNTEEEYNLYNVYRPTSMDKDNTSINQQTYFLQDKSEVDTIVSTYKNLGFKIVLKNGALAYYNCD